jgi:hypothetical protein
MSALKSPQIFARECQWMLRRLASSKQGLLRSADGTTPCWRFSGKKKEAVSEEVVAEMLRLSLLKITPAGNAKPTAAGLKLIGRKVDDRQMIAQHSELDLPSSPSGPLVNATESAVNWLANRHDGQGNPRLSDEQLAAAARLRADYEAAQLGSRVTANWDLSIAGKPSAPQAPGEKASAAKHRFFQAVDAVGPELSGILFEVCCLASGMEQAERRLSLPVRSGKAVLQLALSALARHYKAAEKPQPRERIRSWGTDGYRPAIS